MKKKIIRLISLCVTAVLFMSFIGCSSGNESEGPVTTTGKNPYVDEIKVAYLPMTLGSTNGTEWGRSAEEELSHYKNITFNTFDGKGSAETQNEIISELIVQKYDAVIMQAADSSALSAAITRAEESGLHVITLNIPVDAPHSGHVAAANRETGELVADAIGAALGGKGQVALIDVPSNMTATVKMGAGFRDVLAEKYPDIELVADQAGDWSAETANSITRDFLSKHPDLDAIFTSGDAAAIGAMQAAEAAGKTDLMIWGSDGEKTALEYIEENRITGTIYTDFHDQGALAARLAMYAIGAGINGSSLESTPEVKVPPLVVTIDNINTIPEEERW